MRGQIHFLGPQRPTPNLSDVLSAPALRATTVLLLPGEHHGGRLGGKTASAVRIVGCSERVRSGERSVICGPTTINAAHLVSFENVRLLTGPEEKDCSVHGAPLLLHSEVTLDNCIVENQQRDLKGYGIVAGRSILYSREPHWTVTTHLTVRNSQVMSTGNRHLTCGLVVYQGATATYERVLVSNCKTGLYYRTVATAISEDLRLYYARIAHGATAASTDFPGILEGENCQQRVKVTIDAE